MNNREFPEQQIRDLIFEEMYISACLGQDFTKRRDDLMIQEGISLDEATERDIQESIGQPTETIVERLRVLWEQK